MNSQNKAIRIAGKVFRKLFIMPGKSERSIAVWIRKQLRIEGAHKEAFRVIVASGKRSAKTHGFASKKILRAGDVVVVDFGALYKGFRSDITRTYVLGKFTKLQRKIYKLLIRAQKAALCEVAAGVECRKVDLAARKMIKKAGFGMYFKHATGHGIGRKTHEPPRLSKNNRNRLKVGQVVTIEPGIYLKRWGMRIEDMIKVTRNGYKLLTKVPK